MDTAREKVTASGHATEGLLAIEPHRRPVVLLVSPLPPRAGGIAVQSALWLKKMRIDGWTVRAIRNNTGERQLAGWPRWLRRAGLSGLWLLYVIRAALGIIRADVVVLMTSSWLTFHLKARPVLTLASWLRRPVVLVFKGGDAIRFLDVDGNAVIPAIGMAARVVVQSPFLRDAFGGYGVAAEVIPNLIDGTLFGYRERSVTPLRGLVTRSLEDIYNNACAIRAWSIVRHRYPDAELWIAGEGPERAALERLAGELCAGAVRFFGHVPHEEMGHLYDACSILLNPSNIDNMPGSVLEAQTAGLPVVSTNVGGVPLIVDDGRTGLLVPPNDPQAMAAAVERLIQEPSLAARVARQARDSVTQYEWGRVGARWSRLITDVFQKREKPSCVRALTTRMGG